MLPFQPPLEPMLAELQESIPSGEGWVYEPKWDGFRCIVYRDGESVHLSSRNGQPLERYFPEVVVGLKRSLPERCIVDGEIILPGPRGLDFEALSQRIHPAASRINRLAGETPAGFVAFDCLGAGDDDLREAPGTVRRARLLEVFQNHDLFFVTPQTMDATEAQRWFVDFEGAGCDGVIARRVDLTYQPGKRVMVKVKHGRTADCVVGAYREGKKEGQIGSLLLGVYDEHGVMHLVGHTSSFKAKEKAALHERLQAYRDGSSFGEGRAPDAPSRWNKGKESAPTIHLRPELVCEVKYDYLQGPRFRHAATFLRWRTDKNPRDCTFEQLLPPNPFSIERIIRLSPGRVAST